MALHTKKKVAATISLAILLAYLAFAYVAAPTFWTVHDDDRTKALSDMVTITPDGISGDPINVGLVGSREEVVTAFHAAKWDPADPITLKTSVEIGLSVVLDRPDLDAPVSTLLFEGRPQDFAFEKPVGDSADQRNHVRLWLTPKTGEDGRPLWLGSVTFDRGVGLSHDTGQITHHIGPDVDAERDLLIKDLTQAGWITSTYSIEGIGATTDGRNGGGDPYYTDGEATVGILRALP